MANKRDSSVEFARILFSIGVILLHYNSNAFESVSKYSNNYFWLLFVNSFCVGAVNFFVMVSGYYLSKSGNRKLIRILELLFQAVLFNVLFYFGSVSLGTEELTSFGFLKRLVPENYYVMLYCCLYLFSPYCNILIEKLRVETFKRLIVLMFAIFSVLSYFADIMVCCVDDRFITLNPLSSSGSSVGCNLINFILLYYIGAYIRISKKNYEKKRMIFCLFLIGIIIFLLAVLGGDTDKGVFAWCYNNPFVILFVAVVVQILKQSNFDNNWINELSKASYTCFLFHGNFLVFLCIDRAVNASLPILIVHQLAVGVGLYCISYAVYKIYSLGVGWLVHAIEPICDRLNLSLKEEDII